MQKNITITHDNTFFCNLPKYSEKDQKRHDNKALAKDPKRIPISEAVNAKREHATKKKSIEEQ